MSVAYVRQQIADNPDVVANQIFTDTEIEAFISQAMGNLTLASANALRSLAANEALVLKKMSVEGEDTDGAAVAESLRKIAFDLEMLATAPNVSAW